MTSAHPEPAPTLLTIKEAAALLRVSEISLRRWTDSGALACVRVGGRRERRFRKVDLVAFLDRRSGSGAMSDDTPPQVCLAGLSIPYGRHLCAFYASEMGRDKLAVPFLVEALERGERCYLVAGPQTADALAMAVAGVYPDLEGARARGDLHVRTPTPDPAEVLAFFREEFVAATHRAYAPLRVLGDMAGFVEHGATTAAVLEFETLFDQTLAHKYPVVSLCQYDARVFSGVDVLAALERHSDTFEYPLRHFLGE